MVTLNGDKITFTTSLSIETLPSLYRALVTLIKETADYATTSGTGDNMDAICTVCSFLDEVLPMDGQIFLMPDGLAVINNSIVGEATKGNPAAVLLNLQKSVKSDKSDFVTKGELLGVLNAANLAQ